ncbi:MAG: aminofutalosine synthase MqnE [Pseudomonadota bacterium]
MPVTGTAPLANFAAVPLPPLAVEKNLVGDPALRPVAAKLAAGQRLEFADGLALMTSRDLIGLGALASAVRRHHNQDLAFYVRNRHINYSNVCVNQCAFCAFWRHAGQDGAYLMSPADAAALAAEGLKVDELHIVGSCHPDLPLSYYEDLLRSLAKACPGAALKAFTAVEIDHLAQISGQSPLQVLERLQAAGLAAMPGGGAEIFSPRVRAKLCPRKTDGETWLGISGLAHGLGLPTNATMLYGHIETPAERVEHLMALRQQQDQSGGFSAFIPLAFHAQNTQLDQHPTSGLDDLRVIAASRLILDNFPHIKAYWVMLGEKLAQVALSFGADDLDGTIVEERITHMAGATSAKGLTENELRRMIRAAGYRPARRDSFYNRLPARDSGPVSA